MVHQNKQVAYRNKGNSRSFVLVMFVFVLFLFLCLKTEYSHAAQDISNMSATVGVNPVFGMTAFPLSLDFPLTDPGTTTEERQLTLWCSSNNGQPWSIQLSNLSELTSGSYTMPNDNFNWWGWSEGTGTWNVGTSNMSTTPFTFYDCSSDEYLTEADVVIHLSFNVDIPVNQMAGSYMSTLIITMIE